MYTQVYTPVCTILQVLKPEICTAKYNTSVQIVHSIITIQVYTTKCTIIQFQTNTVQRSTVIQDQLNIVQRSTVLQDQINIVQDTI